MRYNGTLYYYVLDLQGDVIAIIDESGAIVASYCYNAWGEVLSATGTRAAIAAILDIIILW